MNNYLVEYETIHGDIDGVVVIAACELSAELLFKDFGFEDVKQILNVVQVEGDYYDAD